MHEAGAIQRISKASRRGQSGFTLIELLVVIIILGILAAVVVFAVRGAGDKGRVNAVAIDERTIRTAQESYCAKEGRYGTADELVSANLLSERPTLNAVMVDSPGPCGSTSYQILATHMPAVAGLNGTTCEPGAWCQGPLTTSSATGNRSVSGVPGMVLLNDGRVFASKGQVSTVASFSVFDPNGGPMGAWSPMPPTNSVPSTTPLGAVPNASPAANFAANMVVVKGGPELCGSNCGKVLAKFPAPWDDLIVWRLYDPNTPVPGTQSLGSWTDLTAPSEPGGPYRRSFGAAAVQLTRSPCGDLCGKFLVVGGVYEDSGFVPTPADPEIWDPADGPTGSFRKLGLNTGYQAAAPGPSHSGILLNDGRVVTLFGNVTQIFDPLTETFATVEPVPLSAGHSFSNDTMVRLADGKILVSFNRQASIDSQPAQVGIFDPASSVGAWEILPGCAADTTNRYCHFLTTLPDGRILAKRTNNSSGGSPNTLALTTHLFDPVTKTWSPLAAQPGAGTVNRAVLMTEMQPGSCGQLCNRVLMSGAAPTGSTGSRTSVYTP